MNKPFIIDDALCDVCEAPAMPFEYGSQLGPLCAVHSLEGSSDICAEDYEIDVYTEREELERIALQHLPSTGVCETYHCTDAAAPRIMNVDDSMEGYINSEELCTRHAVQEYLDVWLPDMDEFIHDNNLEILFMPDPYADQD